MSIQYPSGTPSEGDTFVHEDETYTYHHGKWAKQYTYSGGGGVSAITSNTSAITVDSSDPTNPLLDVAWGSTSDTVPRGSHVHSNYLTKAYVDDVLDDFQSVVDDTVEELNNTVEEAGINIRVINGNPASPEIGNCWYNSSTNTLNLRVS